MSKALKFLLDRQEKKKEPDDDSTLLVDLAFNVFVAVVILVFILLLIR